MIQDRTLKKIKQRQQLKKKKMSALHPVEGSHGPSNTEFLGQISQYNFQGKFGFVCYIFTMYS